MTKGEKMPIVHIHDHKASYNNGTYPRVIKLDDKSYYYKDVVRDSKVSYIEREKIIALLYEAQDGETICIHKGEINE